MRRKIVGSTGFSLRWQRGGDRGSRASLGGKRGRRIAAEGRPRRRGDGLDRAVETPSVAGARRNVFVAAAGQLMAGAAPATSAGILSIVAAGAPADTDNPSGTKVTQP